jgi:putrescine transport system substrate-binding protein
MAMRRMFHLGLSLGLMLAGCSGESHPPASGRAAPASPPILNVYNWSEFIDPGVIADFQRESGIKVNYDVYDSNEIMEAKLLAGHTGYDIAVPGGAFFEKEVKAGVYQKLEFDRLPHLKNLDPDAAAATAVYDPGNQYGVDYMWLVSTGVGYDAAAIKQRMPDAPVDSWRLILDPAVVARFKGCGVSVLDSPEDVVAAVLSLLGRNPNSESPADLQAVQAVLMGIRPSLRYIDSSRYVQDLANGDLCLAIGWSGDVVQSRRRAREAGKDADIVYVIPREGSVTVADVLAIPADAPHAANALEFIDYLLRPEVAARNVVAVSYASGVAGSVRLLPSETRLDPAIYPSAAVRARLTPMRAKSPEFTRALMRMWTEFKTG